MRLFPPTIEELVFQKLKMVGLPEQLYTTVLDILNGKRKESSFICCHSDCEICNGQILQCINLVRSEMQK